jgi:hypothetical protein
MTAVRFCSAALLAALMIASLRAEQAGEEKDQPPTLLDLIRKRLDKIPELQPDKGVRIEQATYSRGVVRLIGAVKTVGQRKRIAQEVLALRPVLQSTLDLRVREIDVSGLAGPKEKKEGPPRLPPPLAEKGREEKPAGKQAPADVVGSGVVWDSRWGEVGPAPGFWPGVSCAPFWSTPAPFPPTAYYGLAGYGAYYNPYFAVPATGLVPPFYYPW